MPVMAMFAARQDTRWEENFRWIYALMHAVYQWDRLSVGFVEDADLLVVGCDDKRQVLDMRALMRRAQAESIPIVLFAGTRDVWCQLRHSELLQGIKLLVVSSESEVEPSETLLGIRVMHGFYVDAVHEALAKLLPTDDPTV